MRRYTVDHQAGRRGDGAVLSDDAGRPVFSMNGDWAVTNAERRTVLFISPNLGEIAKAAIIGGLIDGLLGGATSPWAGSSNPGPGAQTVKRARVPVRGIPARSSPVASVTRTSPGRQDAEYQVKMHEPALPEVTFVQGIRDDELTGLTNGFARPRDGVFDLVHADGTPILRHWATIGRDARLEQSAFDVEDGAFPLAEAVMIAMARFAAWRY